ncbi:MAG: pyridoxal-phosphate dependent enzyme [Lewinellaceae bacterium]|nr:pyridoxal-phosphate dependent enzyme [Lewinellaceae bacterium]
MPTLSPLFHHPPSPVQELFAPLLEERGIRLFIKRDELLRMGPGLALCGNKWRKLQYNLLAAQNKGHDTLLTFGGAFSNHIAAVAAAGQAFGFKTIGIIRGERPRGLNPTLRFAEACGMQLHHISRSAFRDKGGKAFQDNLQQQFGNYYLLPEGGTNTLAIKGCLDIVAEVEQQLDSFPTHWCCSVGTGGTMAGIIAGVQDRAQVLGFPALKGDFVEGMVREVLASYRLEGYRDEGSEQQGKRGGHWAIIPDFHFGGYAKWAPELVDFINHFYRQHGIALGPVYTGKLFYGLFQLIERGYFQEGSTLLAVHTGGLQGIEGFNERFGPLLAVGY